MLEDREQWHLDVSEATDRAGLDHHLRVEDVALAGRIIGGRRTLGPRRRSQPRPLERGAEDPLGSGCAAVLERATEGELHEPEQAPRVELEQALECRIRAHASERPDRVPHDVLRVVVHERADHRFARGLVDQREQLDRRGTHRRLAGRDRGRQRARIGVEFVQRTVVLAGDATLAHALEQRGRRHRIQPREHVLVVGLRLDRGHAELALRVEERRPRQRGVAVPRVDELHLDHEGPRKPLVGEDLRGRAPARGATLAVELHDEADLLGEHQERQCAAHAERSQLTQGAGEILVELLHRVGQQESAHPLGVGGEVVGCAVEPVQARHQRAHRVEARRLGAGEQRHARRPCQRLWLQRLRVPPRAQGLGDREAREDDQGNHGGTPTSAGPPMRTQHRGG
ncbi:MAG: hypothetical protein IPH07_18795 [Deltaproteobacteria bacterium]|nr:hypothetical protein [Deltaproteobacteria bacterium]